MNKLLNKKEASKALWEFLEARLKSLKALYDNPLHDNRAEWQQCAGACEILPSIVRTNVGSFYKLSSDYGSSEGKFIIVRLEGFSIQAGSTNCLTAHVRVLTSTTERKHYDCVSDTMEMNITDFVNQENIIPTPTKDELLLFVGNKFNGTLLQEMLKGA